jgi:hypothetical protein
MNIFKKIGNAIELSTQSKEGKTSSTRISSYFILGAIVLISLLFIAIEIVNAIIMWKNGAPYVIPGEHIAIFGMILTHHLALLGINKTAETKVEQAKQAHNKTNPKDMSTEVPKYPEVPDYIPDEGMDEGPSDAGNV